MLNPEQVSKLLGRTLTATETANFDLYLGIALSKVKDLLCIDLCTDGGKRSYKTRNGYQELYVDPFTTINSVKIDGEEVTDYVVKQNNSYNGGWYNIIEFEDKKCGETVVVDAVWGFDKCPADLALFIANLFNQNSVSQTVESNVKSKKIEDYSITYKDTSSYSDFIQENSMLIAKYGQCNLSQISHGYIRPLSDY